MATGEGLSAPSKVSVSPPARPYQVVYSALRKCLRRTPLPESDLDQPVMAGAARCRLSLSHVWHALSDRRKLPFGHSWVIDRQLAPSWRLGRREALLPEHTSPAACSPTRPQSAACRAPSWFLSPVMSGTLCASNLSAAACALLTPTLRRSGRRGPLRQTSASPAAYESVTGPNGRSGQMSLAAREQRVYTEDVVRMLRGRRNDDPNRVRGPAIHV